MPLGRQPLRRQQVWQCARVNQTRPMGLMAMPAELMWFPSKYPWNI
jgi:hypothetical protein